MNNKKIFSGFKGLSSLLQRIPEGEDLKSKNVSLSSDGKDVFLSKMSQLCYLDIPTKYYKLPLKVGSLCKYYLYTNKGRRALKNRFGNIYREHEQWEQFLNDMINNYYDIEIVGVYDNNHTDETGLYASIFLTQQKEYVIAFRGSEMLGNNRHRNDYDNNFALAYMLETPQQLKALEFINECEKSLKGKIYLTGHSLGGNLALYIMLAAKCLKNRVEGCYAYNAPGFNDDFLITYAERIQCVESKIFNIQNKYDIISSIFNSIGNPIIIDSTYNPYEQKNYSILNLFYPHSNFCFKIKNGSMVRSSKQKKCRYCNEIFRLTRKFLQFPIYTRRDICGIVLDIIYDSDENESIINKIIDSIMAYFKGKKNVEAEEDLLSVLDNVKYSCENCSSTQALDAYREIMNLPTQKTVSSFHKVAMVKNMLEIINFGRK